MLKCLVIFVSSDALFRQNFNSKFKKLEKENFQVRSVVVAQLLELRPTNLEVVGSSHVRCLAFPFIPFIHNNAHRLKSWLPTCASLIMKTFK